MLKGAFFEHREACRKAAVLEKDIREHGGGREKGAVLQSASAEHGGGCGKATVLEKASREHGKRRERGAVLQSTLSEHGRDGKEPPFVSETLLRA